MPAITDLSQLKPDTLFKGGEVDERFMTEGGFTCYRDLGRYKIYVKSHRSDWFSDDRKKPTEYELYDTKTKTLYRIYPKRHYGDIKGFINALTGAGNDIKPGTVLALARKISKETSTTRQAQLNVLARLAQESGNDDIAAEIMNMR